MRATTYILAVFSVSPAFADAVQENGASKEPPKAIEIPLKEIWAHDMPGTRDVLELDPDPRVRLWSGISRSLRAFPAKDKEARAGFAVQGTGLEALRQVHSILVKGKKPPKKLPSGSDVYLAFFSYQEQPHVHLHHVERKGPTVSVRYRFAPREEEETSSHFALIPLGKLPGGNYCVNVVQSPMRQKDIDAGFHAVSNVVARRIVCNSFSFTVLKHGR